MLCSDNVVLCMLAKFCKDSIFALAAKYHFSSHVVLISSMTFVRQRFRSYFYDLLQFLRECVFFCILLRSVLRFIFMFAIRYLITVFMLPMTMTMIV